MRVLVVGSGGREHALCERLAHESDVICAPGNPGIARVARCIGIAVNDLDGLTALARDESVGLVIVGPEAPLVAGLADQLAIHGILCFGPSQRAAELEGSKAFAKDFMARHGIPTADFASFTDADAAAVYIRSRPRPVVVKASGLAAGKGVVVCSHADEAIAASDEMLLRGAFGEAGARVVIEDRLDGEEVSLHVISDGHRYLVMGAAQDHKRLGDGDTGPNTGGMGASAPVPVFNDDLSALVESTIVRPTLAGMAHDGREFRGVLFVGLMVLDGQPTVLEYNARFGDPECAVILARTQGPILPVFLGAARGRLLDDAAWTGRGAAVAIVLAAAGYPTRPRSGDVIHGLAVAQRMEGVQVLHAGTREVNGDIVTSGGRVLTIVGSGADIDESSRRAYTAADAINFAGMQVRRDIGWRARRTVAKGSA